MRGCPRSSFPDVMGPRVVGEIPRTPTLFVRYAPYDSNKRSQYARDHMYRSFFELQSRPFENTPDPSFFFETEDHQEALAAMRYGVVQQRGMTLVVGRAGCGKSLLASKMIDLLGARAHVLTIPHVPDDGRDLAATLCRGFSIRFSTAHSTAEMFERLRTTLESSHQKDVPYVLIVDQAHLFSIDTMSQLCSLAAMETTTAKLLQIVLLGHPDVISILGDPRLEALRQRIFCVRQVGAFNREQTGAYIKHRLRCAGAENADLFDDRSVDLIHDRSRGVPRLINQLADNALLAAFGASKPCVDAEVAEHVLTNMMDLVVRPPAGAGTITTDNTSNVPTNADETGSTSKGHDASALQGSLLQLVATGSEIAKRLSEANHNSATESNHLADRIGQLGGLMKGQARVGGGLVVPRSLLTSSALAPWDTRALRSRLERLLVHETGASGMPTGPRAGRRPNRSFLPKRSPPPERATSDATDSTDDRGARVRAFEVSCENLRAGGVRTSASMEDTLGKSWRASPDRIRRNLDHLVQRQRPLSSSLAASVRKINTRHDGLVVRLQKIRAQSPTKDDQHASDPTPGATGEPSVPASTDDPDDANSKSA